jgi:hypothetical protein
MFGDSAGFDTILSGQDDAQQLLADDALATVTYYVPSGINPALLYITPGDLGSPGGDVWGGLPIPTDAGPQISFGQMPAFPAGDPALKYILDFLYAWLVVDGNITAAWASTGIPTNALSAGGQQIGYPPVKKLFAYDPTKLLINETSLPSLWLWRANGGDSEWLADDWLVERSVLKLLWVWPEATAENQVKRDSFLNALAKTIQVGLERGRTPSFNVPGDTDPISKFQGSSFWLYAGFMSLVWKRWRPAKVVITLDDGPPRVYYGMEGQIELAENLAYGLNRFAVSGGAYAQIIDAGSGTILDQGPLDSLKYTTPASQAIQAPQLTSVTPSVGAPSGGAAITIAGLGLDGATGVRFRAQDGSITSAGTIQVAPLAIKCTTPALFGGAGYDVLVNFGNSILILPEAYSAFDPGPHVHRVVDGDWTITEFSSDVLISLVGMTVSHTVTLPSTPGTGMRVAIKTDASIVGRNVTIAGNGNTIDGQAPYVMSGSSFGPWARIVIEFDGNSWTVVP